MDEIFYKREELVRKALCDLRDNTHFVTPRRINPDQLHKAYIEFMKFGDIFHFPLSKILEWKEIIIYNCCLLDTWNEINGHAYNFPEDEIEDILGPDFKTFEMSWSCILKKVDKECFPLWSNGHELISDYGLPQLWKVIEELHDEDEPKKILPLISIALNITHPRSDFSELFIIGGSKSLDKIEM